MEKDYIQSQFATYEISLKLKELGFDESCFGRWTHGDDQTSPNIHFRQDYKNRVISDNHQSDYWILAPLWQQVIDWFREKHNIVIEITRLKYFDTYSNSYTYEAVCKVYKNKELDGSVVIRDNKNNHIFYSYEEVREQAILKAIELCQK